MMAKRTLARKPHKDPIYTEAEACQQVAAFLDGKPISEPGRADLHPMMDPATYDDLKRFQAEELADQIQTTINRLADGLVLLQQQQSYLQAKLVELEHTLQAMLAVPFRS